MTQQAEIVIFVRTFDLLLWLVPVTNHFPRSHRHTLTQRVLNAAFDLREHLEVANVRKGRTRLEQLQQADEALAKLRMYLRLLHRMDWLTDGQYHHVARLLMEIGRLLGGWQKQTDSSQSGKYRA
ncbi:MAG: diversity-generating retroelement protein Avd [Caldilineaceae bacterium]